MSLVRLQLPIRLLGQLSLVQARAARVHRAFPLHLQPAKVKAKVRVREDRDQARKHQARHHQVRKHPLRRVRSKEVRPGVRGHQARARQHKQHLVKERQLHPVKVQDKVVKVKAMVVKARAKARVRVVKVKVSLTLHSLNLVKTARQQAAVVHHRAREDKVGEDKAQGSITHRLLWGCRILLVSRENRWCAQHQC